MSEYLNAPKSEIRQALELGLRAGLAVGVALLIPVLVLVLFDLALGWVGIPL